MKGRKRNAAGGAVKGSPRMSRRQRRRAQQAPGVILLQVDGLSRFQLERALKAGRMGFLSSLLRRGSYVLRTFYPGQPSSTPAVQAEIMYGKRCAVPAFSFYDAERDADFRMYDADWAQRISEIASQGAAPLLEGGSSYGNIYSGGAARFRYCGENNTFSYWMQEASLLRLLGFALRYPKTAAKVLALCFIEFVIALYDSLKGALSRGDFLAELTFIASRVGVSIALREAIRYRVSQDIKDGLPIIHANFFGYDEQAHRRGPHSLFAHWSLAGIDGALRKIARLAWRKGKRNYEVIIFSDHGQEAVTPYDEAFGETIEERTERLFEKEGFWVKGAGPMSDIMERARHAAKTAVGLERKRFEESTRWIRVKAMGPVGHVYVQDGLSERRKQEWARRYVSEAGVGVALYLNTLGDPRCVMEGAEGDLTLLESALAQRGHPFVSEVVEDLEIMAKSGLSGDLILLGWRPNQKPLSFASERGAHAGPGAEETRGFALLPSRHATEQGEWMRGLDLRELAFTLSGRCRLKTPAVESHSRIPERRALQIATYNVHGGVGADRRFDADRIARVVADLGVDVVCFQEAFRSVDGSRSLEGALRERWRPDLRCEFLALHTRDGFHYGLLIATTLPMRMLKSTGFALPEPRFARREPRGAQLVELSLGEQRILVANTHFGLNAAERVAQARRLLDEDWLGNGAAGKPLALAGDFNAGPSAPSMRLLRNRFQDAQEAAHPLRAQASFLSWAPIRRIDHILSSKHWEVREAGVYRGPKARSASDHLPVFADLILKQESGASS